MLSIQTLTRPAFLSHKITYLDSVSFILIDIVYEKNSLNIVKLELYFFEFTRISSLIFCDMKNVSSIFEINNFSLMGNDKLCGFTIRGFTEKYFYEVATAKIVINGYILLSLTKPTDVQTHL
jgi:hypothetical protein